MAKSNAISDLQGWISPLVVSSLACMTAWKTTSRNCTVAVIPLPDVLC